MTQQQPFGGYFAPLPAAGPLPVRWYTGAMDLKDPVNPGHNPDMDPQFGAEPLLVVGSIYGGRQWNIDPLGRLRGVIHPQVWRTGANMSVCSRRKRREACLKGVCRNKPHSEGDIQVNGYPDKCLESDPCGGASVGCSCGFWAYYDTAIYTMDGMYQPSTFGIIEGFGKTTIGTKGFRSSKARIVALYLPLNDAASHSLLSRVKRNYDDGVIKFFSSYTKMLEAYPLEEPERPTPTNDPNFWTRDLDETTSQGIPTRLRRTP